MLFFNFDLYIVLYYILCYSIYTPLKSTYLLIDKLATLCVTGVLELILPENSVGVGTATAFSGKVGSKARGQRQHAA